jgi:hypothetical protein
MKAFSAICVAALVSCASEGESSKVLPVGDAAEQLHPVMPDYRDVVSRALNGNVHDAARLIEVSGSTRLDGSGSEGHRRVLLKVRSVIGKKQFDQLVMRAGPRAKGYCLKTVAMAEAGR